MSASEGAWVGVELGGTKVVCAVGAGGRDLGTVAQIPTTSPTETLARVSAWIDEQRRHTRLHAIGVASFGPLDLDPSSGTYGHITTTPKPGWEGTDLVDHLEGRHQLPVALDTDVNGAAVGEHRVGVGRGADPLVYVTIGTGIGGGVIVGGAVHHGVHHTEMGHLPVRRHPDDAYPGWCQFHGDCLEGLAAGPALQARFGVRGEELTDDIASAVELEAWYLAQLVAALRYLIVPARVVLGGGVTGLTGLLPAVRTRVTELLAGAVAVAQTDSRDPWIVGSALNGQAGVVGALELARDAAATVVS